VQEGAPGPRRKRTGSERSHSRSSPHAIMTTSGQRQSRGTESNVRRYPDSGMRNISPSGRQVRDNHRTHSFPLGQSMPRELAPGSGFEKNVKIVGTNPTTSLESIKPSKNEPKTNPKSSPKCALKRQNKPKKTLIETIRDGSGFALRLWVVEHAQPQRGGLSSLEEPGW